MPATTKHVEEGGLVPSNYNTLPPQIGRTVAGYAFPRDYQINGTQSTPLPLNVRANDKTREHPSRRVD